MPQKRATSSAKCYQEDHGCALLSQELNFERHGQENVPEAPREGRTVLLKL